MQGNNLEEEINRILANLANQEEKAQPEREEAYTGERQEEIIEETIEVYFIPGASADTTRIIDSDGMGTGVEDDQAMYLPDGPETEIPQPARDDEAERKLQRKSTQVGIATALFGLLLILSSLAFQINLMLHPPTVIVTLGPKSQEVTLTTTLQFGRVLTPITLSQTATTPTTGKGHQDAKTANGSITFYNGLSTVQRVAAGTIITGQDGISVVTQETATIPPANPPSLGETSVTAQATQPGSRGNIQAGDINITFSTGLYTKNTASFTGGRDARGFQTVTKNDIDLTARHVKDTLNQSTHGALQGELKAGEVLAVPTCSPRVSSDHQPGDEATSVKVSVSITCSAVAYNENTLQQQATQLLTTQAFKKLGPGYSLFGMIQVTVTHAIYPHTIPTLVLSMGGIWSYAISDREQERIKNLIKGRTYQDTLRILHSLPGIEKVSVAWDENTNIPKDPKYIHLVLITGV